MPDKRRRFGSGFDSDAAAYFSTAGITNTDQKNAWNTAVLALKAGGYWDEIERVYPCLGSTSAQARYCAKTLAQATAVNNPSFAFATGWTYDTTNYLRTGFIPSAGTKWSGIMGYLGFCVANKASNSSGCALGGGDLNFGDDNTYIQEDLFTWYPAINLIYDLTGGHADTANTYLTSRVDANETKSYENGVLFHTDAAAGAAGNGSTYEIWLGGKNEQGSLDIPWSPGWTFTTYIIGGNVVNATGLSTILNDFNNTLGRNN